jgi:transposase
MGEICDVTVKIGDKVIWSTKHKVVLGDIVIINPDYPHTCPHCGHMAYIGGDGTVDCSSCEGVMQ